MTAEHTPKHQALSLTEARKALDQIDDHILALLSQRVDITAAVKLAKQSDPVAPVSPLRPAREAVILRRLVSQAEATGVSPSLVVRLWRSIISDSSLRQAPISLHVSKHLNSNIAHRLRLRDYFGPLPVEEYRDETQALTQLDGSSADLCVVETEQPWIEAFMAGRAGIAKVIAALPVIKEDEMPKLLLLGHAPTEASGDDETLVLTDGKLPRDFVLQPRWQSKIGALRLSCLPGYLTEHEGPLVGLVRSNPSLKLKIAGHYASAISTEL
ncbi:MAG: chorismate mutase [Alphaproteobacteria bacterium]|nr:chorismate mutase [Alphaproteobacteria bacterium]